MGSKSRGRLPSRYTPTYRHWLDRTLDSPAITSTDPADGGEPISPPQQSDAPAPRFVCPPLPDPGDAPGQTVHLDADQARHARKVLRLPAGAVVQLLDGQGRVALARLIDDDPRSAGCLIESVRAVPPTRPLIELATAIPKGPRGDAMINDLAQLGVDRLIPLITERSVVDPRRAKLERFARAAAEAAKQSGRAWFMGVDPTTALSDALESAAELKLVADPYAGPLASLAERLNSVSVVRVLVGPEGGLADEELGAAREAGFMAWRYSPNVLRVETAAAAAVAILRSQA